jgi:hypothetical protein
MAAEHLQSPLRPSCAACRVKLQLTAIDAHPDFGAAFEIHAFVCPRCRRTQTYTLRRRSPGGQRPPQNRAGPRGRRP